MAKATSSGTAESAAATSTKKENTPAELGVTTPPEPAVKVADFPPVTDLPTGWISVEALQGAEPVTVALHASKINTVRSMTEKEKSQGVKADCGTLILYENGPGAPRQIYAKPSVEEVLTAIARVSAAHYAEARNLAALTGAARTC